MSLGPPLTTLPSSSRTCSGIHGAAGEGVEDAHALAVRGEADDRAAEPGMERPRGEVGAGAVGGLAWRRGGPRNKSGVTEDQETAALPCLSSKSTQCFKGKSLRLFGAVTRSVDGLPDSSKMAVATYPLCVVIVLK